MEIGKLPSFANRLIEAGDVEGAQTMLLEGLQREPGNAVLWAEAGYFLYNLGNFEDSAASLERAGALGDRDIRTAFHLGAARYRLGQFGVAETYLKKIIGFDDRYGDSFHILGLALAGQGRFDEAIEALNAAVQRLEDPSAVHDRLWRLKCLKGDWAAGWGDCLASVPGDIEQRWQSSYGARHRLWRGETLNGAEIVVISHGGYGDVINFFRFVDSLIDEGPEKITLIIPESLHRLIQDSPAVNRPDAPIFQMLENGPLPEGGSGYFTWFEGLAAHYGAAPGAVASAPYLCADSRARRIWADRFGSSRKRRAGLVWRGSPAMPEDHWRSIPIEQLAPLFEIPGLEWYSLQGGDLTIEESAFLEAHRIADLSPLLTDFAETAAVMANLDLIISVDSAPAHLAGALGCETWLLNRATSEWRWGWRQRRSFWYPTMRLFNQQVLGDWTPVLTAMADELHEAEATLSV